VVADGVRAHGRVAISVVVADVCAFPYCAGKNNKKI